MKKTRKKQKITIAVVMIGIVGLAVGFATFSASLSIKSNASVKPDASGFSVVFSSLENKLSTEDVTPSYSFTLPAEKNATATKGIIDNVAVIGPKISNLQADFTEPGQTVIYEFYARNEGEYLAYLNQISIGEKSCVATTDEAQNNLVEAACNGISINVKVGNLEETDKSINLNSEGITHTLDKTQSEKIIVTLVYDANGTSVDGPFRVKFGNIELTYSTITDYVPPVKNLTYFGVRNTGWTGGPFAGQPGFYYLYDLTDTSKTPTGMILSDKRFAYNDGMSEAEFLNKYSDWLNDLADYFYSNHSDKKDGILLGVRETAEQDSILIEYNNGNYKFTLGQERSKYGG